MYSFLVIGWDSALWPCQGCGGVWGLRPGLAGVEGSSILGMVCDCHLYAGFAVLGELLMVRGWGGLWAVSKVETSLSEVYLDWKLQWHFTCGFDFRHGLWLSFVAGFAVLKGLSANPTKWLNTKKQFVWACLAILCGWHLKGCPLNSLNLCWMFRRTEPFEMFWLLINQNHY